MMPYSQQTGTELTSSYFHAGQGANANPSPSSPPLAPASAPQSDYLNIEITVRDKQNQKKRLVFSDDPKNDTAALVGPLTTRKGAEKTGQAADCIIPISGVIQRGKWTNLCIDLGSLSAHLFSQNPAKEKQAADGASNGRGMAHSRGDSNAGDSRGAARRGASQAGASG